MVRPVFGSSAESNRSSRSGTSQAPRAFLRSIAASAAVFVTSSCFMASRRPGRGTHGGAPSRSIMLTRPACVI